MKAVIYQQFAGPLTLEAVPDPTPSDAGVVIEVKATGLCRSDWHGWMGHDPGIALPNVPGHELAGVVADVGKGVTKWRVGDRVTLPFVCGCGSCSQCGSGNQQVCDRQFQPGFTAWGSFAQYVAIDFADVNLVRLPDSMNFVTAASLGCRFATAFRAVADQGKVVAGQWVAVHGCGGVGLSAIMIANALGAKVIAIDIDEDKLAFAKSLGAAATINANRVDSVIEAVMQLTSGGVHVSLDALGSPATCFNSVACLRKRGRHMQVGLMLADQSRPAIPMDRVVADELQIVATHGMPAHGYPRMLDMIAGGQLEPDKLIGKTISLEDAALELSVMDRFKGVGVTVVNRF
ncbi:MAG: zinc-dependent alcohol dehydrogenase family protein [Phycisphaeraceae bacterium]